jgi:3-hydroxyisobutyrate dehydrogenase-like beta-hydroxyacid dehydrogenase
MAVVAVVGVGIMGRGMVRNLLAAGHEVVVWNRTPARVRDLVAAGATGAATPAEAAARAEVVLEVTADDASSRRVWSAADGILAGAAPDAVLITSATLSIEWITELGAECARRALAFLDVPVTGGSVAAERGELVLLVGGDPALLARTAPVFDAIGREVRHFGPVGAGTRFKLVLNALQAVHLAAFGEAMRLATEAGLDPALVGPALVERPGGVVTGLAWQRLHTPSDSVAFSAEWAHKDLTYAARMAASSAHPFLDAVHAAFRATVESGRGQEDWSVVNR